MIDNNHTTEDSTVETIILKGKSGNNNFNIDLGESSYVIRDSGGTDTLTFKNTKVENLEYSIKDGRHYIRDKQTKNVVTFDDTGGAERGENIMEAYNTFQSAYDSNETTIKDAIEKYFGDNIDPDFIQRGINDLFYISYHEISPEGLLPQYINNLKNAFGALIEITNSRGDGINSLLFLELKTLFDEFVPQFAKLANNHSNVIEEIILDGKTHAVEELLFSKALNKTRATYGDDSSKLVDMANVIMLKKNVAYYSWEELEKLNIERYETNTMVEYMAEFKDLGQRLGIQELPFYSSSDFMPPIVQVN
ncbi:hypothetical protein [Yersinia mollaretii]|uniref:hypothetical protein n=1 Tax=Yersinia mollaretii TaxID=33060 RepID=UPI0005E1A3BC|nr:hypothetical protein [Yersinia mollaretii]CNK25225.1 Uncharacterised protein [Yersinia enterocolitica]